MSFWSQNCKNSILENYVPDLICIQSSCVCFGISLRVQEKESGYNHGSVPAPPPALGSHGISLKFL